MSSITRYDPFNDLDDLFKGFFVRPMRYDGDLPSKMSIKVDVSKSDEGYTVKAEMPGVRKEDIQVAIDANVVTISGEVKQESEQKKGEKVLRSEAGSKASYNNGVLQLMLPTRATTGSKKLTIE
jgi:HSP20 family protein